MKTLFLTIAISLLALAGAAQSEYLYNYSQGLSNSLINDVFIDNSGMLWVSTQDGLNVFNGSKFKRINIKEPNFNNVCQLSNGDILVSTNKGLYRYDIRKEKTEEISFYSDSKKVSPFVTKVTEKDRRIYITTSGYGFFTMGEDDTTTSESVLNKKMQTRFLQTVFIDTKGRMWISSFGKHNYVFDSDSKPLTDLPELPEDIIGFAEDSYGNIYAASHKSGLVKIHTDNSIMKLSLDGIGSEFPTSSLYLDGPRLYVGTDGLGLKLLDINSGVSSTIFTSNLSLDFSKSKVHSISKDSDGNLWLGIYQKGLMLIRKESTIFDSYCYNPNIKNSIGSSSVGALEVVGQETWIGTDGDGIYTIDSKKKITHYDVKDISGERILCNIISLFNDNDQFMWIGTYNSGLIKFDIKAKKTIKTYHFHGDKISKIIKGDNGNLLFTSLGGGIGTFNPKTEEITAGIVENPSWANSLAADKFGNLWIATYDGLMFIDRDRKSSKRYTTDNNYVPDNAIHAVAIDSKNHVWAGTNKGVLVLDPTTDDKQYLLNNKTISAIVQDELGFMWISSLDGLYRYDPQSEKVLSFKAADGLMGNEFTRGAGIVGPSGMACFGGISGVSSIKTDNLIDSVNIGNVMIHSLVVNNKEIHVGDIIENVQILGNSLAISDTIFLPESANNFSLNFNTTNPANFAQTSYKCKMAGFDNDYISCGSGVAQATYTNLKNGTYTFEVVAMIGERQSATKRLTIIIHPHWYRTLGARVLFLLLAWLMLFLIWEYFKEKIRHRQSEKINEMKMQFFINISHEIRTPLTLIIDPLEKLLSQKNVPSDTKTLYQTMQINSQRILRLVSQLLDLRKIDKHQVMMKFGKTELCGFIGYIVESCRPIIDSKEININISNNHDGEVYAWIDPENFEKIILNLISNAVKFTPVGGEIDVDINQDDARGKITISITDNGIGLDLDELEKIFQRFYQVKSSQTRYTTGTGVGLHLAKYLTDLHKGRLYAENRGDKQGSRFVVELQAGNSHLPKADLIEEETMIATPLLRPAIVKPANQGKKDDDKKSSGKSKVFIVDDEDSIRIYLTEQLSENYDVMAFPNGKAALEKVLTEKPDLIISDIMMPEMDGWEFCRKLKRDFHTNHIPIILLTALSGDDDKTLGIEIGADMYLEKPFNTKFLLKAVKNLMDNRKKVVDKVENKAENFNIENIQLKSQDEILMQKVMQIIKDKISCRDLNVEMLADQIGISRVHLHRKIKEITGLTARDFLKNIRMKQASFLLTDKNLTISEIAYAVGYSNPAHFSSSFKAFYGISPLAYSQRSKEADNDAEPKPGNSE